jgi:hypothetical protein
MCREIFELLGLDLRDDDCCVRGKSKEAAGLWVVGVVRW